MGYRQTPSVTSLPQLASTPHRHARGSGWAVWRWPLLVAGGWLFLQALLAPAASLYPDSARYAQITFRYLGADEASAHRQAAQLVCADQAEQAARWNAAQVAPDPNAPSWTVEADCMAVNADHFIPTGSPRYQAIFDPRPGYPLVTAALAPLTGVRFALWAVPVASVLFAGLGVWWLLRTIRVGSPTAAAGQALLYLLPVGTWGTQALTDGPVLAGVVAAMLGGVLLVAGRLRSGTLMLVLGLAWTALVKYSTALPLAGVLVIAALAAWWLGTLDRRGLALLGGISAAATAGILAVSHRLGLPGTTDSLQDTFTDHYAHPDVPDVWARLLDANIGYWTRWPILVPSNLLLAAGVLLGGWALWRWQRAAALVVLATAAVGVALTIAHPEVNALDRLYVLTWLAPVVGLPVAVQRLTPANAGP